MPRPEDINLLVALIEKAFERKIIGAVEIKAGVYNVLSILQTKLNYDKRRHLQNPIWVKNIGSEDDYCEVYQFPCCGKYVMTGDGAPSVDRADGCCKKY